MHLNRHIIKTLTLFTFAALALAAAPKNADVSESKLIATLQTGTTPEKAITCKRLAIYGSPAAVPALAALLTDKELASWARIALEAIPGPASDDALRDALPKVQGRLLVGVINSIGYRRDAKAVEALTAKLKDADAEVASSAAAALGKIGGEQAAKSLEQFLPTSPEPVRPAAAEGCIVCAERFLAAGNRDSAIRLYDAVRKADVSKQRLVEATRGAILARQAAGIPILVELLRSTDKTSFLMGLRTARELTIPEVADTLIAELAKSAPERQALLIVALADRGDAKALPVVLECAKTGPINVRIAATSVLERLGNASCVLVLLEAATDPDAQLAQAAKTSLARLPGKPVESELLARMHQATGKTRQVLIELAAQRRIDGALPIIAKFAEDPDAGVRTAAIETIGAMGDDKQALDLTKLLPKLTDATDRAAIEKALMTISGRSGAACTPALLALAKSEDPALRAIALRVLPCCGGPESLAAVQSALADKDESVQNDAVRALSTWPNRWPDDASITAPLLSLAKSTQKVPHRVLALRGYLQYVQGAKNLSDDAKLTKINDVLPLLSRPEEKRLAISSLSAIGTSGAIDLLVTFASDPTISEEACSAIVNSKNLLKLPKPQRAKALQVVSEKSKNETTKQKADQLLKSTR